MRSPRGHIVCPKRAIPLGGAYISGPWPGLVIYVRCGSGRLMRELTRFCSHVGIHLRPVQEVVDGRPDAFEAIGTVDALERLIGHPAILNWHYILSTPIPRGAQGSGEVSERVRKVINRQRLPKADRLAADEWERRAKLSREERLDMELHDARQLAAAL